jgi:hypothetical protein
MVGIILALIFSFFHSAIWESGQLDVWRCFNPDYYVWGWVTDYWLGLVDPIAFNLNHSSIKYTENSIGALILFAMWALAAGKTAMYSISGFMGSQVILAGIFIQALVRKIFGLGFWSSLAISIGILGGAFFNYLVFAGQVGQLVATTAYLGAMAQIFSCSNRSGRREWASFFIPLLLLFLAYQGGFGAYVFFLALACSIVNYFGLEASKSWLRRIKLAVLGGIKPVFIATSLCFLVAPVMGCYLINRSVETAQQLSGWKLSFISPWLISGFPIYRPEYFLDKTDQPHFYWYLLFLTLIGALTYMANKPLEARSDRTTSGNISIKKINSATIIFVISIIIYIFSYYLFDNRYQVWKFISFMGLPLSFVFIGLLVLAIKRITKALIRRLLVSLLVVWILAFGIGLENFQNLTKIPKKYYDLTSARPLLNIIRNIIINSGYKTHFILNFRRLEEIFLATEFFKLNSKYKFTLIYGNQIAKSKDVLSLILRNSTNYIFISDQNCDNVYNNCAIAERGKILVNDMNWIDDHGIAQFYGLDRYRNWFLYKNWLKIKILVPKALRGKRAILSVNLKEYDKNPGHCRVTQARLAIGSKGEYEPVHGDVLKLMTEVNETVTTNGLIIASVVLDLLSSSTPIEDCSYYYNGFDLVAAN